MSNAFIDGLGAILTRAREARGITRVEVANRLKLTPRQIEAIETEDWAHLPGEVFLRGFVRNYARLLDLSPEELIRPVDREATATTTITAPSEGLAIGRSPIARWVVLPLAVSLLFLLVVALLYQWLRQGEQTLVTSPPAVPAPAGAAPAVPADAAEAAAQSAPPAAGDTVVQPLELAPQPLHEEPAVPAPDRPPTPAGQTAGEAAPPAGEAPVRDAPRATSTLQFMPDDDAWIQVVDGQGQRFSKLVRAGVAEQLTGTPPFKLVVGNAANVKLTYNGHQIDLKPFIGEKVARLTLE